MELFGSMQSALRRTLFWLLLSGTSAILTSCGGSSTPAQVGLPTPPAGGSVNSYVGGQANSPSEVSPWSVTIDHTKNVYSYTNPNSAGAATTTGSFAPLTGGFLVLLGSNGYQNGLALELPGEAVILRPGDTTAAPVFAVQQSSCFAIGGSQKFLFVYSPGLSGQGSVLTGAAEPEPFFGRIYASTSSDGNSWQFDNLTEFSSPLLYVAQGVPSDAGYPGYAAGYPGTCSASNGTASVTSSPMGSFTGGSAYPLPTQSVISPGGFFFTNQSYANVPSSANWNYPAISAWGLSEPPEPLTVGGFATANYVGFLTETTGNNSTYFTQLVGFGNAPIAGTTMTGGTFPNDDPTQLPIQEMSVTFGSQDALNNGVYYLAKLNIPYGGQFDSCASPAPGINGIPTCTYSAVATVSHLSAYAPYSIMVSAVDSSGNQKLLVLFHQ
jgi:hypothetical protein